METRCKKSRRPYFSHPLPIHLKFLYCKRTPDAFVGSFHRRISLITIGYPEFQFGYKESQRAIEN